MEVAHGRLGANLTRMRTFYVMKIFLDGSFVPAAEAEISVFDHGLLYGDGIFEGIRLYDGCVFKLEEHLERLEFSAKALMLTLPMSRQEISDAVCETCRQNNLRDGYIRDRKSTRLNSSHVATSYAVFCVQ